MHSVHSLTLTLCFRHQSCQPSSSSSCMYPPPANSASKAPHFCSPMEVHNYNEEFKRLNDLVKSLVEEIDYKNYRLSEMQLHKDETNASICRVVNELVVKMKYKDRLLSDLDKRLEESTAAIRRLSKEKDIQHDRYVDEISHLKSTNIKMKNTLESQRKELEQLTRDLKECKSQNTVEQKNSEDEKGKVKGESQIQDPVENLTNSNAEIEELRKQLNEKEETLEDLQNLNQVLITKEKISNQEVQDARKEAVKSLEDILSNRTTFVIKRMGEIDSKAFLEACSRKFSSGDLQTMTCEVCSTWQEVLKDAKWHPFKHKVVKGQLQEIIDEDDEKIKELRSEYGEAAYEAVANALLELNEHNPSGRYAVPEVWNTKEKRKASLKEIVSYLIKQLKTMKSNKRKRRS